MAIEIAARSPVICSNSRVAEKTSGWANSEVRTGQEMQTNSHLERFMKNPIRHLRLASLPILILLSLLMSASAMPSSPRRRLVYQHRFAHHQLRRQDYARRGKLADHLRSVQSVVDPLQLHQRRYHPGHAEALRLRRDHRRRRWSRLEDVHPEHLRRGTASVPSSPHPSCLYSRASLPPGLERNWSCFSEHYYGFLAQTLASGTHSRDHAH